MNKQFKVAVNGKVILAEAGTTLCKTKITSIAWFSFYKEAQRNCVRLFSSLMLY